MYLKDLESKFLVLHHSCNEFTCIVKNRRLKVQISRVFCISSQSSTKSSTCMYHEDGAIWNFMFCDVCELLSLWRERRYILEDKWTFFIRKNKFSIKKWKLLKMYLEDLVNKFRSIIYGRHALMRKVDLKREWEVLLSIGGVSWCEVVSNGVWCRFSLVALMLMPGVVELTIVWSLSECVVCWIWRTHLYH